MTAMSTPLTVRHISTGDEYSAWIDPEGVWVSDPADPGYISADDRLPRGWEWVR